MYMRLTWAKLRAGCWPQYEANYKALNRSSPGLLARWLLRDTNDLDALFVLSHWTDLASMHAWEQSDYFCKVFLPSIRPVLAGEFTVSVCEVRDTVQVGTVSTDPIRD